MHMTHKYPDGCCYGGDEDNRGCRHGDGQFTMKDNSTYVGRFENGLCSGVGVMTYADGTRYEGQFDQGQYHGYGVLRMSSGMMFQGQFCAGLVEGLGLMTLPDGTHGSRRLEGLFKGGHLISRQNCTDVVRMACDMAAQSKQVH